MNTETLVGCRVKLQDIMVPNLEPLEICSLLDRSQYHDPQGQAEQLGISSAWWPLFGMLWPSALYLVAELARRPVQPEERVLEIGCGLALPSLFGHRRGVNITASDHHPLTIDFLQHNLKLNHLPPTLAYRHGHWGEQPMAAKAAITHTLLTERYQLIIGSDLLYERTTPPALASFIDRHALPNAEVWIVDANRGHRAAFNRCMTELGFALEQNIRLNQAPCLSGAKTYKGHLMKYRRNRE